MKVSIFGLGYVGTVSYGCLSQWGHDVIGVDVDHTKLELLESGISPIVEEGMQHLIKETVGNASAMVTDDVNLAIEQSDMSFICVGTPSERNGKHNLSALKRVCEEIGTALARKDSYHVVVIRSTVTPGTTETILKDILQTSSGKSSERDFGLCFQPEFLREGVSIKDFNNPPMTILGGDAKSVEVCCRIFGELSCKFYATSIKTAEMVKFCCNSFHALKVTFANEVGRLSKELGIDGREVMSLLCEDNQLNISTAYMKPGFAFGGSCLPKDLRALSRMATDSAVSVPMLSSVLVSNEDHIRYVIDLVLGANRRKVGVVGLSFKGGTDDLRESPLLELVERLLGKGMQLQVYDPEVSLSRLMGANKRYVEEAIPHIASILSEDCGSLVEESEIVILGIRDDRVESLLGQQNKAEQLILDLVGLPDSASFNGKYVGVCW